MSKELKEAVIVAYGRAPIAKGNKKGALRQSHPVDLAGTVLQKTLERIPQLDPQTLDDVIVGCSNPEYTQGMNFARLIASRAGCGWGVPGQTVNRFCSSGLQTIITGANMIAVGQASAVASGGMEQMSSKQPGSPDVFCQWIRDNDPGLYQPMGVTAENVAERYGVTREEMDAFAVESHRKAAAAIEAGKFDAEIIPVPGVDEEGNPITFSKDQGVRANTTMEGLAGLKTVFKENGAVTAGQSSQVSDGTGFVVQTSREKAQELGLKPLARFIGYSVAGVDPSIMGIGPIKAVPKVLAQTGLALGDMAFIELNEAFAAQAIPCIRELGLDEKKVNPNGGAIALGHPTGATGAILTGKSISELQRTGGKYAMITMCIGGGMGAAAILELL